MSELLFAYGTLLLPEVLARVVGRPLQGRAAQLHGYARRALIGRVYPAIVPAQSSSVHGTVYTGLTARELLQLDHYEGALYQRRTVTVQAAGSQLDAHVYVLLERHHGELSDGDWDLEHFRREHLAHYASDLERDPRAP